MAGKSFSYNFIINGAVNNSLISSFGRVNRLTQTMSIQNIDLKNSIAQINNAFRSGTVSSATYAARMKELSSAQRAIASTALKSSSSSLFFSAANLQNTVGTIRSIAAPIESAVKTAMSFEAAMSKVKAITMADNEETKQLTDTARELGKDAVHRIASCRGDEFPRHGGLEDESDHCRYARAFKSGGGRRHRSGQDGRYRI